MCFLVNVEVMCKAVGTDFREEHLQGMNLSQCKAVFSDKNKFLCMCCVFQEDSIMECLGSRLAKNTFPIHQGAKTSPTSQE